MKVRPKLKEANEEVNGTRREVSPWESDYELLVCEGLFSEYLEMGKLFFVEIWKAAERTVKCVRYNSSFTRPQ